MRIQDLNGKNVCVLGFGKEGRAMVKALQQCAPDCEITIADENATLKAEHHRHWMQTGTGWLNNLNKFDAIITSPGIPPQKEFQEVEEKLTSATQIFLDTVADVDVTVVGVTGSKGKSTTASLIAATLKAGGKDAHLAGNIGDPAIAHLDEARPGTVFVLEMSSYQLMHVTRSPHIAVITSFFPEHLDYHGSLDAYREAKKNITRFQTPEDIVLFPADSPSAATIAKEGDGRKIPFSANDAPVTIDETHLIGRHNLQNIAAACKVADLFAIPVKTVIKAVTQFRGLPHRLERIGTVGGIAWVDDAISTTPESAIAALDALGDRVSTIILGGQDRGYDFTELAERLKKSSVTMVILFPGSGPRIRAALERIGTSAKMFEVNSMEEAVAAAKQKTGMDLPINQSTNQLINQSTNQPPNQSTSQPINVPIVLLSPASPSYGVFKNFEERGNIFKKSIVDLK